MFFFFMRYIQKYMFFCVIYLLTSHRWTYTILAAIFPLAYTIFIQIVTNQLKKIYRKFALYDVMNTKNPSEKRIFQMDLSHIAALFFNF